VSTHNSAHEQDYDAIIIGGGHNGLVTAAYLAKSGLRVAVLERQHALGGAAQAVDILGKKTTAGATWSGMLRPDIVSDLKLYEYGYTTTPLNPQVLAVSADGRAIGLFLDEADTAASVSSYFGEPRSNVLAEIARYESAVAEAARFVSSAYYVAERQDRLTMFASAPARIKDFLASSIRDILRNYNFPEFLKSAIAAGALSLTNSDTTVGGGGYALAYMATAETAGNTGAWGIPAGGMYALIDALAAAATNKGAEIRTATTVAEVLITDELKAIGVELENGERIHSSIVVGCIHPADFFSITSGEKSGAFRPGTASDRPHGTSATVKLLLASSPMPAQQLPTPLLAASYPTTALYVVTPTNLAGLDAAFADYRTGREISDEPLVTFSILSAGNDTEEMLLSAYVQFVNSKCPESLLIDKTLRSISQIFPDVVHKLVGARGLNPSMLEHTLCLPGGHPEHTTMTYPSLIDQRPHERLASYRTPVQGLYAAGAGWFPGGTLSGVPGRNVASIALQDISQRDTSLSYS